ncbi:hypothetical protein BK742_13400 [Bacillus thuringiensis serovar pingluonsis]|uniref:Uncharacterized protein n=4 Tax=Bacillus thuringiensis TaxID=1428 RepID=A0A243D0A5_BACTU|nr:hypothetical protein CU648_25660 [Bacillus sp. HBCD-sjtu]MBR9656971.1 hypothetical protein [Bacillus cereus]OPD59882.1 hypothetical protein BVG01_04870 [Bacillus anthracis]OTW46034.1 hypothetical protein BK699_22650 [Bacillus thuringiensis serovar mexicanensis]OTX10364.1 hypothetical protein BK705_02485 [Bacillus thuringiensis serovar monterrey]OTX37562.1 hypothetical protein BK720_04550 [Bacillus thuringiensis serovar brasilensis]OTY44619.1 hypothetical protein BK742_13400 [Bacillus thuri
MDYAENNRIHFQHTKRKLESFQLPFFFTEQHLI